MQTAVTFMAAVGDIRRFPTPRKLVAYLGLDRRVRWGCVGVNTRGRESSGFEIRATPATSQMLHKPLANARR